MDREAWHAAIHVVAKSWTWMSNWTELNWTEWFPILLPLGSLLSLVGFLWHFFSISLFGYGMHFLARGLIQSVLHCTCAQSLQSCPTLSDLMDYNPPGSSVHGILQARILEWVAMPSSRGSSQSQESSSHFLCLLSSQVGSLPPVPSGKPLSYLTVSQMHPIIAL